METKWEMVFKTKKPIHAEIVKGVLGDHGMQAVIINKNDSIYGIFGYAEVHVPLEESIKALNLIEKEVSFEE